MEVSSLCPWLAVVASFTAGIVAAAWRRRRAVMTGTGGDPRGEVGVATVRFPTPIPRSQPLPRLTNTLLSSGVVASCNQRFASLHGFDAPAAAVGESLRQLLWASDYRTRLAVERLICDGGRASNVLVRGRRRQGPGLFTLDDWVVVLRDDAITELRITQREVAAPGPSLALARREVQLSEALAASRTGTWRWEIDEDTITWSSSTFEVFGITPGSFGGTLRAFAALVHPDDRARVMSAIDDAVQGHVADYVDQFRVVGEHGLRWLEGRGRVENEAEGPCMTGTVVDITDRKLAEQALRDSEQRFASLAEAAFECIAVTVEGRFVEINQRFLDTFGFTREQLIGRSVTLMVHPDDHAMVTERIRQRWTERYEHRAVCADGSLLLVEVQGRELPVGGTLGRVTSLRDVTRLRKHEAQLVRIAEGVSAMTGEAFFRSLVENLGVVLGADHAVVAEVCRERPDTVRALAAFAAEGDAPRVELSIPGSPIERAMAYDICVVADGVQRRFPEDRVLAELGIEGCVALAVRDPSGQASGLLTVMFREALREPTVVASTLRIFAVRLAAELERRRFEAALRESEARLRATVENTPNVAVQWYDEQGRVLFWNKASEHVFGWSVEDAVGRTLDQLICGEPDASRFLDDLRHVAATGETVGPRENPFRRRDGGEGVCLSTLFAIPSDSGRRTFVCMDVDVTARKEADRRREELAHHLINAQEAERRRLAGELHDGLGQSLSVIKNRAHLGREGEAHSLRELEAIERLVTESLHEVRTLVHNLRPLHVEAAGLTGALQNLVDEVAASTAITFDCRLENIDGLVEGERAVHVYRIAQEALHNMIKHSRAKHARVRVERDLRYVRLHVEDDGVGFGPATVRRGGLGLDSMAERASMLDATLTIDSQEHEGTALHLDLPIEEELLVGAGDGEEQS